jgi:hypothetical protein
VPFATIEDMSTIDLILALQQVNLNDGGLAGDDVPVLDGNRLVFVERAFVLDTAAESAALLGGGGSPAAIVSVPEPSTLVLAVAALMAIIVSKPSKKL